MRRLQQKLLAPLRWVRAGMQSFLGVSFLSHRLDEVSRTLGNRVEDLEELLLSAVSPLAMKSDATFSSDRRPMVSIILPTVDRPVALAEAINSVLAQTFQDWELVVVSDGGSAATLRAVSPFLRDTRITLARKARGGASSARNLGIKSSNAPLIAYLDDDNLWFPQFLERAVELFDKDPACDLAYGALVTNLHGLRGTSIMWQRFDRAELLRMNYIDTNVVVHRRELVQRFGAWDESSGARSLVDWELVLRYTAHQPPRRIATLAALYREVDDRRISVNENFDASFSYVRKKHRA